MNHLDTRPTILFISAFQAPFIQDDLDFLATQFHIRKQIGHGVGSIFGIISHATRSDCVFCWFASVYAFIGVLAAKAFGIKSALVVGGVDVAKEKGLDYGIWLSPWRSILVRYALRNADRVLVVDPCLRDDAMCLAEYDGKNIVYLPTGYDTSFWKPMGEKENTVLTVAMAQDVKRIRLKGIDTLIETARMLPDVHFLVIGMNPHLVEKFHPPSNIVFHPPKERKELLTFYRQAKVYCQPSRREGLPNTLCEAMLCGCVPVATDVGGNRTAVGDTGILVSPDDAKALAIAIHEALKSTDENASKARARIVGLFPKQKREDELFRIIQRLTE